jgi:hypothetical protein
VVPTIFSTYPRIAVSIIAIILVSNQKPIAELHDFTYGLLPDSNDAQKTLSKLERSNINHFYILHDDTGLYAFSKGPPSNEEVRTCLDCSAKIQVDLE